MSFRGILCLFWARSEARPQRGTGKGWSETETDGGNETEAADSSPSVQELENLHACKPLLTRCIVGDYCVPDSSICIEGKRWQTNTLWCQTSKMLCIISRERIRRMIMRWIIWFREKNIHNYATWAVMVFHFFKKKFNIHSAFDKII